MPTIVNRGFFLCCYTLSFDQCQLTLSFFISFEKQLIMHLSPITLNEHHPSPLFDSHTPPFFTIFLFMHCSPQFCESPYGRDFQIKIYTVIEIENALLFYCFFGRSSVMRKDIKPTKLRV